MYKRQTQNSLRSGVLNLRVGSDEGSRAYSLEIADDRDNFDTVVEAAYRQIFFHAFKTDRDVNLESQLKDGQITVRDFIRGLLLSDTFKRTFYGFNSNYKVVRHLCERILGRKVNGKGEELSWSIVIATKGLEGLVDVLDPRGQFDPQQWAFEQLNLLLPVVNHCGDHCPGPPGLQQQPVNSDAKPKDVDPRWQALQQLQQQIDQP